MAFGTAIEHRVPALYHWQPFTPANAHWLRQTIGTKAIYCPSPSKFNDPWDCKPHFNTTVRDDPTENERHVEFAERQFRKNDPPLPEGEIARRKQVVRTDRTFAAGLIEQMSDAMAPAIADRYRVYCLGTDPTNILMWSHYADSHQGVCLEFSARNEVMCGALKCEYLADFPMMKVYSDDEQDAIRILRFKARAWEYEDEYRLIAQEGSKAVPADTLMTDNSLLQLPAGALTAVIVGCQGNYNEVRALVQGIDPGVAVKRAVRVPNKFALRIEG